MIKCKSICLLVLAGLLISFIKIQRITIYTIGDSTMANKGILKNNPERGWGQVLSQFFDDHVRIDNWAKNGRSSKSFMDEGLWKGVLEKLKPGDYVFIQFGHNDSKLDSALHTDPRTTYRMNLIKYVTETRAKGACPVLLTSIVRRKFDMNGKLQDTHGDYIVVVRELAREMNVPLIDMERKSRNLVEQLCSESSKKLYMWLKPGVSEMYPEGLKDDTHFCEYGAVKMASLAVEGIKELKLEIADYIKK